MKATDKIEKATDVKKPLPTKYHIANQKFKELMNNPPDVKTSEPMDIYNWVKQLVDLTKI